MRNLCSGKRSLTLLALVGIGLCTLALRAEPPPVEPSGRRSRGAGNGADETEDEPAERGAPHYARRYRRGDLRLLEQLREEDPERFAGLMQLRQDDREAFRRELRQFIQEVRPLSEGRFGPRQREAVELVRRYHQTDVETERSKLEEELRQLLAAVFDEDIERYHRHIEALSERLQRMTRELDEKKDQRERLINQQLQYLLDEAVNGAGD